MFSEHGHVLKHAYEEKKRFREQPLAVDLDGERSSYDFLGKGNAAKAPAFSCPVAVLVVPVRNALRGLNKL